MKKLYVTARARFAAAHRLYGPGLTDEENRSVFGACSRPHGHNYAVEVRLQGAVDPRTGYLFDLIRLKRILREEIIHHVDHQDLNEGVDFLHGVNPTAENLAVCFWQRLERRIPAALLHAVRVYETADCFAEYRGERIRPQTEVEASAARAHGDGRAARPGTGPADRSRPTPELGTAAGKQ